MDKCPTDVSILIFDYACASDPGCTARRLGLVSKYFRSIAEPLEFRTLVITGPDQLSRVLVRLKRLQEARLSGSMLGGAGVNIQHLFICDLKMKHALASDTAPVSSEEGYRLDFWETRKRIEANRYYKSHGHSFWSSSSTLVRSAGTTLITITALQLESFAEESPSNTFSGAHLPRLKALTLEQTSRITEPEAGGNPFVPPTAPSLRRLHLMGVVVEMAGTSWPTPPIMIHLHPLLEDMHSRYCALTHPVINHRRFLENVDMLMEVIHGFAGDTTDSSASANGTNRQLPGKLLSAVLQLGRCPSFRCGNGRWGYERKIRGFINDVRALRIDGLEVHPPTPRYPEEGNRKYEVLLAEWKSRALN